MTVTFDGTYGPGVPDPYGHYVTPYEITIDDGSGPVVQVVTCYDELNSVSPSESWQAYEYSLTDVVTGGMFVGATANVNSFSYNSTVGYQAIGWLSAQTYSNTSQEVALQYAIWNVFGTTQALTGSELTDYNNYESALASEVAVGFTGFDFSNTVYLESYDPASNPTSTTAPQPFVFAITPGGGGSFGVPEPGTIVMIGSGLLCLLGSLGFKRFASKRG
ncbi:MAG TPA: PEP-CTERM sorting domain-containing protein [Bryobacteraceae bacterium]|nr:PEP-CTERM sorting domain-containing protein [Bryobacteraceae bacterium]